MPDNAITLVGNLTHDPELRYTNGGAPTASAGLAVNRRWQQEGEWKEDVSFFTIVAWRELAENLAQSTTKGTRLIVQGRLSTRSYEDKDGQTKTVTEIVVEECGPSLKFATADVTRNERKSRDTYS